MSPIQGGSPTSTARSAKCGSIRPDAVIHKANRIAHKILKAYSETNRTKTEIRDFLASNSVDLFADFGDACRAELGRLQMRGVASGRQCSG